MPTPPWDPTYARTKRWVAQNLAARVLAQPWTLSSIARAVGNMLPKADPQACAALAAQLFTMGEDTYPPAPHDIVAFLLRSEVFNPKSDDVASAVLTPPAFAPLSRFADLAIPALATPRELAAWLGLSIEELEWFSDERDGQAHARTPQLLHYHYALVRRRVGKPRLLEAPKARLKAIQRRLLREILVRVPVHDRVHGFVAGRSCLSGSQVHAGEAVVATFDLAQFFPSISAPRIHGIFRSLGYPWSVARHLTGLCTTATPISMINRLSATSEDDATLRAIYGVRHLPQGAPTSPVLANLLAWRLDRRLHGLARRVEANYTRYADDLAFSGAVDFARSMKRFSTAMAKIIEEEGFRLNPTKTRVMPRHLCQRVTGIVVNDHCNLNRSEFDRLKAILTNCTRADPRSQNLAGVPDFRGHLEGRIAWFEQVNPRRGAKLRQVFERIDWAATSQT